eukprot:4228863-Amphidinium_carterae.1
MHVGRHKALAVLAVHIYLAHGCSFLAHFHGPAAPLPNLSYVNEFMQRRGPDATNHVETLGWTFLHNLLSLTGA